MHQIQVSWVETKTETWIYKPREWKQPGTGEDRADSIFFFIEA